MVESKAPDDWLAILDDEDRAFLKRFLLASGSLKKTAAAYGISYPTVRLRLDRLIAKIEVADDSRLSGVFERTLRAKYAEGRIDLATMKSLLAAYRSQMAEMEEES